MLELQGVSKSYGGAPALYPTDLALLARRTAVLIGPSGTFRVRTLVPSWPASFSPTPALSLLTVK